MEQKKLAAIVGAVTAYIQQEESVKTAVGSTLNSWRFFGWRAQMNARMNAGRVLPRPMRGGWRYFGPEESMVARARWGNW